MNAPAHPYRVAVFVSGSGSNLQALLDAQQTGDLGNAEIVLVVSDRADAYGLQRALNHGVAAAFVPLRRPRDPAVRAEWEHRLADVTAAFTPDLIVLAGFMRVLSPVFLDRFPNRIINQHPALLPDDGGDTFTTSQGIVIPVLRGAHVVADALRLGLPITGCTIHRVTPAVDDGPVLARAEVPILPGDTEETLHERIKQVEHRLIVEVVARLARLDR
ncbi:MAG: phosphoribosylglycinamide formyltransferase [Roseiflexus sp.]|nr:phosphoribosylglycinamide formyltransferase [Roseiflexus sp.]MCS7289843.1 phosphoribosylglycinamide formyltransferase [Roseiflexus sp.]MDW8146581.1 phosphoribosylglycinamide formyltransferase [Roseiflexaceae bacterium]MDW8231143.1 phosphoribosylglycinamide formyltransferase [Roseiflexaceae bacterium]